VYSSQCNVLRWALYIKETLQMHDLKLGNNSRVAVMGGGPAGSLFGYFLLDMADRVGTEIHLDIYEPRDFSYPAPLGCNMCGGIISESLVQHLAMDGINLPTTLVQRGIDSYVLHMDVGTACIRTPLDEKRIGAIYRGAGPRGIRKMKLSSFDGHLLSLAVQKGARVLRCRVDEVTWADGRPRVKTHGGSPKEYDLLAVAAGVNTKALELFKNINPNYKPPQTTKTAIREYFLGEKIIGEFLGSSMHVFLLNIPRLEFAAIIPKGDYVTVCLLGEEINEALLQAFLNAREVKECMPPDWRWDQPACQCSPRINVQGAVQPFGDRLVFLGDSGVTRLYKDGIGAAYRVAKVASTTAMFEGVSAENFRKHFWPTCRKMSIDNITGNVIFLVTRLIQKFRFARQAILRMTIREQHKTGNPFRMSMVLWDMFTGSEPYKEIFFRTLHPVFLARLGLDLIVSIWPFTAKRGSCTARTKSSQQ